MLCVFAQCGNGSALQEALPEGSSAGFYFWFSMKKSLSNSGAAPSPADRLALDELRILLLREGISKPQMAAKCGVSLANFRNEFARFIPARLLRARVEAAFNYRFPIWSDAVTLQLRAQCLRDLGFDFAVAEMPKLSAECRRLGLAVAASRARPDFERALRAYLAAHPRGQSLSSPTEATPTTPETT